MHRINASVVIKKQLSSKSKLPKSKMHKISKTQSTDSFLIMVCTKLIHESGVNSQIYLHTHLHLLIYCTRISATL